MKRTLIVIHRYTSAALCLLFAVWFVSGVAMAYFRTPVLTEDQRLAFAAPFAAAPGTRSPEQIPQLADSWTSTDTLRLARWQDRLLYRWRTSNTGWHSAWADTGAPPNFDGASLASEAERWFGPGTGVRYDGAFTEHSQWSYFAQAREHYPLHRFSTLGPAPRQVFFSSRTGEPIVATSFGSRVLYYLGPGLHYFSFYPIRNNNRLWRGLVNWSSGIGAFTCLVGLIVGLWQLRWRAIGTGRRVVPYAKFWMRWHHWLGLVFGLLTFTFVLSGLFSMNPAGIFPSTEIPSPMKAGYLGEQPPLSTLPSPEGVPADLGRAATVKELEWSRLHGQAYVVARETATTQSILWPHGNVLAARPPFSESELVGLVRGVLPAPIGAVERLSQFDDYYYARKDRILPLPVVRLRLQDDRGSWYYMDPGTGQLFLRSDEGTRLRRWLYNGLHSFDMQSLLRSGWWWDVTIWMLSLCGFALSTTGVVVAWQWIRRSVVPVMTFPAVSRTTESPLNEGEAS